MTTDLVAFHQSTIRTPVQDGESSVLVVGVAKKNLGDLMRQVKTVVAAGAAEHSIFAAGGLNFGIVAAVMPLAIVAHVLEMAALSANVVRQVGLLA